MATIVATVIAALVPAAGCAVATGTAAPGSGLAGIDHIVVIYAENHSFDNLFGGWEGVDGLAGAASSGRVTQVGADSRPLACLPQVDPVLQAVPAACRGTSNGLALDSGFTNQPFRLDDHFQPNDKTWDLVHRFYQEQYQINGGRMDRYVLGSEALGLTMGFYDTTRTPLYRYLHGPDAPRYLIADRFFQAAFGGSFLNHQWLVAARTPEWPGAPTSGPDDLHSVVGPDGMPAYYALQSAVPGVRDAPLTQAANRDGSCAVPPGGPTPAPGTVCGDFAVNAIQPTSRPHVPNLPTTRRLPPLAGPTIGDRLSARGVGWAWYAGGWDNAAGNTGGRGWTNGPGPGCGDPRTLVNAAYPYCPDELFQFHHQPFNYFADYAEGAPGRGHLRDEADFLDAVAAGRLEPVSFVKPIGSMNQHPGYASVHEGGEHLVELLRAIAAGPQAASTMVVVTYDESGGQWDHVPPPRGDRWGPGPRVPTVVISPRLGKPFAVDHTVYDTTSILATIEHRWGLAPLGDRDAAAADLSAGLSDRPPTGRLGLPREGPFALGAIALAMLVSAIAVVLLGRRGARSG